MLKDISILICSDVVFNCPEVSPTIEQIDHTFGATHPGVYDEEKQVFTLTFRGLSFEFPAETQFQPKYGGIRQELGRLQFPPGESPRVSKMYIYCGNSLSDCTSPALPPPRYPCVHHQSVDIIRRDRQTKGLRVRMIPTPILDLADPSSTSNRVAVDIDDLEDLGTRSGILCEETGSHESQSVICQDVLFGDSVQDVVSAIGAPARIFFKDEDKMKIHSPNAHRKAAAHKSDYFYNYFTLGFVSYLLQIVTDYLLLISALCRTFCLMLGPIPSRSLFCTRITPDTTTSTCE